MGIIIGIILITIAVVIEKYENNHGYRFNEKMEKVKATRKGY